MTFKGLKIYNKYRICYTITKLKSMYDTEMLSKTSKNALY